MANPQVSCGSDYFIEVLSQTIQQVKDQADSPAGQQAGKQLPEHLVVVADNTVKSAKNQYLLKFLALLSYRGIFKSTTLFNLTVGHTHEDIDQLFALVLAFLKRKRTWETPTEVLTHIQDCCLAVTV